MNVTGLILAAGFGTRLRPSTQFCPKPLIPVGGVEPLFHSLFQMQEMGIRDVIVNSHYLADHIEKAVKRWSSLLPRLSITVSREDPTILGTGGAIHKILHDSPALFKGRGLLVLNGDTLAAFDVKPLLADLKTSSRFAVSFVEEHLKKYKPLWTGANGEWVGIGPTAPEPGAIPAHFLGAHYIAQDAIEYLAKTLPEKIEETDLFNGIYRPLANEGFSLRSVVAMKKRAELGYTPDNFWFDMTNIEFLLEAQRFVLENLEKGTWWSKVLIARHPRITERSPGVWVDAAKEPKCRFLRPAVFVETIQGELERRFGPLEVGPHASMIHEFGVTTSGDTSLPPVRISNSVVFVSRDIPETSLSSDILDEIKVL
ncbi:MAG: sugar phosphate nucleotidyltransferase [Bdellovibrionota bacterium]